MRRMLIAALLASATVAAAVESGSSPGIAGDARPIGLAELPQPARAALLREAAGKEIGPVSRVVVGDRVYYETQVADAPAPRRVRVTAAGEVVRDDGGGVRAEAREAWDATREAAAETWDAARTAGSAAWEEGRQYLDDDGLTLGNVPEPVRRALLAEAPAERIVDIDVGARGGRVLYTAEIQVPDARNRTVVLDEHGQRVADPGARSDG